MSKHTDIDLFLEDELEKRFGSLPSFLKSEASNVIDSKRSETSKYAMYLVRESPNTGPEIFGPTRIHGDTYTSEQLYGAVKSPIPHFRSKLRGLEAKAGEITKCEEYAAEYFYEVTLFWAEVGKLSEFLGASREVDEIITNLTTARFLFLGKDTPMAAIEAVGAAMKLATTANRITFAVADQVADVLEAAGLDLLVVDSLRDPHA